MDVIYVDSLFILNAVIDYFILLAAARLCPHPPRRGRLALAAGLGGVYAVMSVLPDFAFLRFAPMKLLCGEAMVLIAFGGQGRLLRTSVVFLAVSAAFGGAVWAISMFFNGFSPAQPYIPVSMPMLAVSFSICYLAVSLVFRRIGGRAERKLLRVEVTLSARSVAFTALSDTGNELHEPVSGAPVITADAAALAPLLPPGTELTGDAETDFQLLAEDAALRARLRLIPYAAVGVDAGLLLALRPDRITLNGKTAGMHFVALSPNRLCADGEYQAVI